jgi:hypothetical protein
MPYLPYLQFSCAFNSPLSSKMSTFSPSPAPASPTSSASAQLPIHIAQTFSSSPAPASPMSPASAQLPIHTAQTFSSSPAPASPMLPASAQLPIHTAQTLESSLRTSIAGISAQGSQEIDQLLQSDAWILSLRKYIRLNAQNLSIPYLSRYLAQRALGCRHCC